MKYSNITLIVSISILYFTEARLVSRISTGELESVSEEPERKAHDHTRTQLNKGNAALLSEISSTTMHLNCNQQSLLKNTSHSSTQKAKSFEIEREVEVSSIDDNFSLNDFVEKTYNNGMTADWMPKDVGLGRNGSIRKVMENYRKCFQYKETLPKLVLSREDESIIEKAIQTNYCANNHDDDYMDSFSVVTVGTTELLFYGVGGHFAEHKDKYDKSYLNNPEQTQIGTLVIVGFSPDAVGGELFMKGHSILSPSSSPLTTSAWQWYTCFIPLGVNHQVKPLTKGFRITYKQVLGIDQPQHQTFAISA